MKGVTPSTFAKLTLDKFGNLDGARLRRIWPGDSSIFAPLISRKYSKTWPSVYRVGTEGDVIVVNYANRSIGSMDWVDYILPALGMFTADEAAWAMFALSDRKTWHVRVVSTDGKVLTSDEVTDPGTELESAWWGTLSPYWSALEDDFRMEWHVTFGGTDRGNVLLVEDLADLFKFPGAAWDRMETIGGDIVAAPINFVKSMGRGALVGVAVVATLGGLVLWRRHASKQSSQ